MARVASTCACRNVTARPEAHVAGFADNPDEVDAGVGALGEVGQARGVGCVADDEAQRAVVPPGEHNTGLFAVAHQRPHVVPAGKELGNDGTANEPARACDRHCSRIAHACFRPFSGGRTPGSDLRFRGE